MRSFKITLLVLVCINTSIYAQIDFKSIKFLKGMGTPDAMVTGDFDGDGKEDAIVGTEPVALMFAFYSNGLNDFEKKEFQLTSGNTLRPQMLVGDLNNDGKDDLVILDQSFKQQGSKMLICLSTGRDFTKTAIDIENPAIQPGWRGDIVDFDDDGNNDILLLGGGFPLSIYSGDGDGNFTSSTLPEVEGYFTDNFDFYVRDINNDQLLDLVHINDDLLITYIKDETGYSRTDKPYNGRILNTMIFDFNGDDAPELVATTIGQSGEYALSYFENDGNGGFNTPYYITGNSSWYGLDHADYDDDGKEDILYGTVGGPHWPTILHNLGNHNFEDKSPDADMNTTTMASAFVNSDGVGAPELFVATAQRTVEFYKYDGTEYVYDGNQIINPFGYDGEVYDLDNDGYKDMIGGTAFNGVMGLWYGKGDLEFEEPVVMPAPRDTRWTEVADFNDDGYGDLVIAVTNSPAGGDMGTFIYLSTGPRTYADPVELAHEPQEFLIACDIDNDNDVDVVAARSLFTNDGNGNFSVTSMPFGPVRVSAAVGLFNDDEFPDVMLSNGDEKSMAINNGSGGFNTPVAFTTQHALFNISPADLNGDNYTDVVGALLDAYPQTLTVLINNGDGTFNESTFSPPQGFGFLVQPAAQDVDNDGLTDIVVGANGQNLANIGVMLAKSTGGYSDVKFFETTNFEIPWFLYTGNKLIVTDVDGDAKKDVVIFSLNGPPVSILQNDLVLEPQSSPLEIIVVPGATSASITVDKSDGDGRILMIREVNKTHAPPVDGTFYVADPTFGQGDKIADNYVVMLSDETELTIDGLRSSSTYVIAAYEYSVNEKNTIINYTAGSTSTMFTTLKVQTITITPIVEKTLATGAFTIEASSSSGLPVTLSLESENGTLEDDLFTPSAEGKVTITATVEGNDEYAPANIESDFCIYAPKPTIGLSNDPIPLLTSSSDANNVWYLNDLAVPDATGKTYRPALDGVYLVGVVIEGCGSYSDPTANIIAGVEDNTLGITLSPNPARDIVTINSKTEPVLFNTLGTVLKIPTNSIDNGVQMNISDLQPGIYIIRLQNVSLKLIKQ